MLIKTKGNFQTPVTVQDASKARKQLEIMWTSLRHEALHARQHQGNRHDDNDEDGDHE